MGLERRISRSLLGVLAFAVAVGVLPVVVVAVLAGPAVASTSLIQSGDSVGQNLQVSASPDGSVLAVPVIVSNAQSIRLSSDGGSSWSSVASPSGVTFTSVAVTNSGVLYGVASPNCSSFCRNWFYTYSGGSWSSMVIVGGASGDSLSYAGWVVTDGSTIVVNERHTGRMFRSTNGGSSWTQGNSVPNISSPRAFVLGGYVHVVGTVSSVGWYGRWSISSGVLDATQNVLPYSAPTFVFGAGSTSHLFLVGMDGPSAGAGMTLYESTNSGGAWSTVVGNEALPTALGRPFGFEMGSDGRVYALGSSWSGSTTKVLTAGRATNAPDWSAVFEMGSVTGAGASDLAYGVQAQSGSLPGSTASFAEVQQGSGATYDFYRFSGLGTAVSEPGASAFTTTGVLVSSSCGCSSVSASPGRSWEVTLAPSLSPASVLRSANGVNWDQIVLPTGVITSSLSQVAIADNGEVYFVAPHSSSNGSKADFYRFVNGRWYGPIFFGDGSFGNPGGAVGILPTAPGHLVVVERSSAKVFMSSDDGNTMVKVGAMSAPASGTPTLAISGHYLQELQPSGYDRFDLNSLQRAAPTTGPSLPTANQGSRYGPFPRPDASGEVWAAGIDSTRHLYLSRSLDDGNNWSTIDSGTLLPSTMGSATSRGWAVAMGGDDRIYVFDVIVPATGSLALLVSSRSLTSADWTTITTTDTITTSASTNAVMVAFDTTSLMPTPPDVWLTLSDNSTRHYGQLGGFAPASGLAFSDLFGDCNVILPCTEDTSDVTNFTEYPVNAATGNFWHTFEDLTIPGRGPALALTQTYNSLAASTNGPLGYGWTHRYAMSLSIGAGNTPVTLHQENAATATFDLSGGAYVAPPRVQATLAHNGDGTWTLVRRKRETLTFDSSGNLTAIADLNGYTTTLAYSGGKLSTVTDPASRTLTFTYSGSLLSSVTDSASRSVSFGYDGNGNLTSLTDVNGGVTTFGYDSSHRLTSMLDPNQQSASTKHYLTNVYDASSGKVTSQTDYAGRTTSFDYASITGATKITDPRGNVTVERFTNLMPTAITKAYGTALAASWTTSYDPFTLMPTVTVDPYGHVTTSRYDSAGNLLSRTDPLGRTTGYSYDSLNDLTGVLNPTWIPTTNTYDGAGNLLSTSTPLTSQPGTNRTISYTYGDSAHPGDATAIADPDGKVWTYSYTTTGDPATVTDPTSNVTKVCSDSIGRRTRMILPKGTADGVTCTTSNPSHTYLYTTNAFGDPLTTTDPNGHQSSRAYDADRNLATSTDGGSNETDYSYNLDSQLTVTTRPDSTTLASDYWDDGTLKSQTDGANNATSYTYDALGNFASVTDPDARATSYTYDALGNLLTEQDAGGNCAANPKTGCTTYTYDAASQLTAITYSDGSTPNVTYSYDTLGRRTAMTDGTGTSTYAYDSLGRLTSHTNGAGATVGYGYDLRSNTTTIAYPSTTGTISKTYDNAGRLATLTDWNNHTTSYSYDADGFLTTQTYPNGTTATYTPDDADQISAITDQYGSTPIASFDYERDANNQVTATDTSGVPADTSDYTYTQLNQLETQDSNTYEYDAADNPARLASITHQAFDPANQLCWTASTTGTCASPPSGATTYSYDTRGNRTTITPPAGSATTLGYDQANRLTNYNSTATYGYNGDGLRTSKTISGTTTQQTWDVSTGLPLVLVDGSTNYIYGPDALPLEQITNTGTTRYYHHDQLGSIRLLTDASGSTIATYTYDPYGKLTASTGAVANPFGYAGQYTDAETGYEYLRNRYYDPSTAEFLTRDPLVAQTRSAYAYVNDSPLNGADPWGLCASSTSGSAVLTGIDTESHGCKRGQGMWGVFEGWSLETIDIRVDVLIQRPFRKSRWVEAPMTSGLQMSGRKEGLGRVRGISGTFSGTFDILNPERLGRFLAARLVTTGDLDTIIITALHCGSLLA